MNGRLHGEAARPLRDGEAARPPFAEAAASVGQGLRRDSEAARPPVAEAATSVVVDLPALPAEQPFAVHLSHRRTGG